jgi:hypothetical protein
MRFGKSLGDQSLSQFLEQRHGRGGTGLRLHGRRCDNSFLRELPALQKLSGEIRRVGLGHDDHRIDITGGGISCIGVAVLIDQNPVVVDKDVAIGLVGSATR